MVKSVFISLITFSLSVAAAGYLVLSEVDADFNTSFSLVPNIFAVTNASK